MVKVKELDWKEREAFAELFAVWLNQYTHAVIRYVMGRAEEIINNPDTMSLLRELKEREEKEEREFRDNIGWLLQDYEGHAKYNPHNHCLTHSGSYRDILYDRYIRDMPREDE